MSFKFFPLRFLLSYLFLLGIGGMALTAELWSNDRPLLLFQGGKLRAPFLFRVPPSELGQTDTFRADYKRLTLREKDWALWPINRWDPYASNKEAAYYPAPPSSMNWLGTDDRGRDLAARILYGLRNTLGFAVVVWIVSVLLAVSIGVTTGFLGGWVDFLGQRVVEIIGSVPQLFLLIYLVSLWPSSMALLITFTSIFAWTGLSYFVRGEALRQREMEYVEAAKALGMGTMRTILRHVLPNSVGAVLTTAPFMILGNITALTVLDFFGYGLPAPTSSLGELLQQGEHYFEVAWWLAVFPIGALVLTLLSISLVGEHLRKTDGRALKKVSEFFKRRARSRV
ncbi:MAG: ABC transporter permease subunit [Proteobacteria bacterium]|nr:MAG: ABC transporter permease subunit [Pseudomonadota bacterium]